jgi:hypothetical protein
VYFAIRHFYMGDKKFDTFRADIQQIKIVKLGGSITIFWIQVMQRAGGSAGHRESRGHDREGQGRTKGREESDDRRG